MIDLQKLLQIFLVKDQNYQPSGKERATHFLRIKECLTSTQVYLQQYLAAVKGECEFYEGECFPG